ncbi:hypothetical protein RRU01S_31_00700 [Agrobacterium rubi TR3 = NBRC 13261]|uniref:Uncharacterized protein n=1 Tax=Agrobacterium rubi TR3 = NBRC 13261 TaxID=1368415 RepID=A0A081D2J0_9HYPH|nr:hypothetical protein [Agrobacterium rubi]MBP1881352.1 hypothetical protein [Agrobacterium rubi]GAK73136.1 hypothetical protein RRU01S_31_00700 [Agrobacterium rubi TR3 = NBRC 13261]
MSRYPITVKSNLQIDESAVIGFDPPLRTFFLQAFPDEATDACALWLGGFLEEYRSLESIIDAARSEGYEVHGLNHDVIIALTKEGGTPTRPSIGERLGIVR